jgi:hypothetical protein
MQKYINDPKLNTMSLEQLVNKRIWRTYKNKKYKYQNMDEMDQRHLENAINTFMGTTNHIVLEALYKELERRTTLANIQKQKIIEIKNKMKNETTQLSFIETLDEGTTQTATEVTTSVGNSKKSPVNRIINPFQQRFKKGELIDNRYFIVDVNSANNRGYKYHVRDNTTNNTQEIRQSIFLKQIGYSPAENTKKSNKKKEMAEKPKIKSKTPDGSHLERKYNIGDLIGIYEVLSFRRSRKGFGGIVYTVRNTKTSETKTMKQSILKSAYYIAAKDNANKFLQENKEEKIVANVTKSKKHALQPTKQTFIQRVKSAWAVLIK